MTTPTMLPTTLLRPPRVPPVTPPDRPQPLGSLVAAARRLTSGSKIGKTTGAGQTWQDDCWDMFELVGEEQFLANAIAKKMGQARFYVGQLSEQTDEPTPVEDPNIRGVLDAMGSPSQFAQMITRQGVNLFVAGDGYFVGIPTSLLPPSLQPAERVNLDAELVFQSPAGPGLTVDDLHWRHLSVSEVSQAAGGEITLHLGDTEAEKVTCRPEDVFLIRSWNPHPRRSWEADSSTRSSLSVLREIVGLTTKISAEIDSRLAGAGLLIVPQSAARALRAAAGLPEDSLEDPFTEALIEAMLTPIVDRGVASAYVPLVVTVPDEAVEKFRHMVFDQPADVQDTARRDAAIRRLALGQDAPPELLLGAGSMSHWGAWLSKEDVITSHVEPPLALICDALTTQYLWPVLMDQGMDEATAHEYVIWYDVSDLVVRPNMSQDAFALHEAGAITDEALRAATGFDESAAPDESGVPPEVQVALDLVRVKPELMSNPGLPQVVAQLRAALAGDIPDVVVPASPGDAPAGQQGPPDGGLPQTAGDPAPTPNTPAAVAASADYEAFMARTGGRA